MQGSAHAGAKRGPSLPLEAAAAGAGAALVPPKFEASLGCRVALRLIAGCPAAVPTQQLAAKASTPEPVPCARLASVPAGLPSLLTTLLPLFPPPLPPPPAGAGGAVRPGPPRPTPRVLPN